MWIPGWKSDLNMSPQVMDGDSDSFSSQCIACVDAGALHAAPRHASFIVS